MWVREFAGAGVQVPHVEQVVMHLVKGKRGRMQLQADVRRMCAGGLQAQAS